MAGGFLQAELSFTLIALVEVLAMLLIGLRSLDTDILMQAGAARLVYVVFSNLIQVPLVVLISTFFQSKGKCSAASYGCCQLLRFKSQHRCLLCGTVSCCGVIFPGLYGRPYGCASPYKHPDRVLSWKLSGKMNWKNSKPSSMSSSTIFKWNTTSSSKNVRKKSVLYGMNVKKYILAMQAVAEHGDTEELHKIAQAATDVFERSTKYFCGRNPVVDALFELLLTNCGKELHQSQTGCDDS